MDSKSSFATSLVGSRSPPLTTSFGISAFDMSRGTHPPTLPMSSRMHHFPNRGEVMTRDRIQHALDIIYEKVFNLGQADLYPGLVSGPYLPHNPLFPNG